MALQCDALFDLGNFAAQFELSTEQMSKIVHYYYEKEQPLSLSEHKQYVEKIKYMQTVAYLREAMWAFLQIGISELPFDYQTYAQTYLEKFLK